MKHNNAAATTRTRLAVSAVLVLALAGSATQQQALAQGPGGGPGGPGGFGGPGFGRGPGGGPMGQSPLQSNPLGLLQRAEVQTELGLSVRQKQELTDLQTSSRDLIRERMGQVFQSQNQQGRGGQDFRSLSPEERRQRMDALRPQMDAARTAVEGEIGDKIKAVLTPEQQTRLHQLDLQRRGILSLADPKVADEIKLSAAHRTEVGQIVADYQQQTGEVMRAAMDSARQSGQFPDLDSKLSPTRQKLTKTKKAAEDKVTALLSDQEKAAWAAAIGEPFTFRADPPRQRPFGGPGGPGGPGGRGPGGPGGFGGPGGPGGPPPFGGPDGPPPPPVGGPENGPPAE